MTYTKVTKTLAVVILIAGILTASMVFYDSILMSIVYIAGGLISYVMIYGIGEIVELLHKMSEK